MNGFLTNEEPIKKDKELISRVDTLGNLRVSYNQSCLITILRHRQIIKVAGFMRFIPCVMFQSISSLFVHVLL
jgi:hypothetical protein